MPCETFLPEIVESTKDVLQQWNKYYTNNKFGMGVQCDKCRKWRFVEQYQDRREVPSVWICSMWKIDEFRRGSCRIPSNLTEEDFDEAVYSPGDLVWAKMSGYDWWPGMIEDCPDTQDFFIHYVDSEDEYHVIFFGDKPTRNWIKASRIKDFSTCTSPLSKKKCKANLLRSIKQANKALKMPIKERLMNFSFAVRYKGRWAKINKEEVVMPPQTREMKKPTETRSQLICNKPCAEPDCSETTIASKMESNKLKPEVVSEKNPVDDTECHPIRNEEEIIKNDLENPHFDIIDELKQQFPIKNDEELVKSKMLHALRIVLNRLINKKNLANSISTHEDNKNSTTNHCQQPSLKEESDRSEDTEMIHDGRCNYGNQVPISEENSEEVSMAEIINTPIIIKTSSQGNSIKIISKNGDEFIVSYENLFWEILQSVYPPDSTSTLYDADIESLDTDIDSNCSNASSNLINDCENVGAVLEREPVTADEDKTFVEKESGDIEENKTSSESESVVSCNNEAFLKNEPVTKDEKEESFSDAETIIDDENESTFSDNDRNYDKNEATCSENEQVLNNTVNSILSDGESVVFIENIATSSENNLDQRNTDSLENHSNVSIASHHSSYIPNSDPEASIAHKIECNSAFSGNGPISDEIGTSVPNNRSSNNLVVNHRNSTSYLANYSNVSVPFPYASYLPHSTQKVPPTYTFEKYSTFSNKEPMINDKNAATFSKNNLDPRNATSYLENVSVPYYQASYLPNSASETPCTSKSEAFSTFSGSEPVIDDQSVAFSENDRVVELRKAATYSQVNPSVSVLCSHASYPPHSTSELSVNCENEQYSNQRKRIKRK